MDPLLSNDGQPYAPKHFKELVKECWYISDQLHTSYTDVLDMSYSERIFLIEFINEKQTETKKAIAVMEAEMDAKKQR